MLGPQRPRDLTDKNLTLGVSGLSPCTPFKHKKRTSRHPKNTYLAEIGVIVHVLLLLYKTSETCKVASCLRILVVVISGEVGISPKILNIKNPFRKVTAYIDRTRSKR